MPTSLWPFDRKEKGKRKQGPAPRFSSTGGEKVQRNRPKKQGKKKSQPNNKGKKQGGGGGGEERKMEISLSGWEGRGKGKKGGLPPGGKKKKVGSLWI